MASGNYITEKEKDGAAGCFRVETPVIADSVKTRKCVTRDIALLPSADNDHPCFSFVRAGNFKIEKFSVIAEYPERNCAKAVRLGIKISYDIFYSDGEKELIMRDTCCFELIFDKIDYRKSGLKRFCGGKRAQKSYFTASALADSFGQILCESTGALIIDIGIFFIIKSVVLTEISCPAKECPAECRCKKMSGGKKTICEDFYRGSVYD